MSRIRVMAVVLVVPALVVMLQVTNVFAWSQLVVATGCKGDSPTVTVKASGLDNEAPASGGRETKPYKLEFLQGPNYDVVATADATWKWGGGDNQTIFSGNPGLKPGTYAVRLSNDDHGDSTSEWFTIAPCTTPPTPTPTPSPTPTPAGGSGSGTPGLPNTGLAH
jgi:hypothetical protein